MEIGTGANAFAYLALFSIVPIALVAFGRLRPATAAAALAVFGCALLPEEAWIDIPLMPPLSKNSITYLAILLGAAVHRAHLLRAARPGSGPEVLLIPIVFANIGTVLVNSHPVRDGAELVPGMGPYDALSLSIADLLRYALPLYLGRALVRSAGDLRELAVVLAIAGLVQACLLAIEVALTGVFGVFQFKAWVYGVASARPIYRWGMLQPVVFQVNALALAMFFATSLVAAAGLAKARIRFSRLPNRLATALVLLSLVRCLNVAAITYGSVSTLLMMLLDRRRMASFALAIALVVCIYPGLRMGGWFPAAELIELAEDFDADRARSMAGRFREEEALLTLAREHLWLGWGPYDRIPLRVDEGVEHRSKSIDGFWVILAGMHGIVGMELRFAFLLLPVWIAWRKQPRFATRADQTLLAALMAIVAIRALDLLPNGWWNDLPAFLAGSLFGVAKSVDRMPAGRTTGPRSTGPRDPDPSPSPPAGPPSGGGASPTEPRPAGLAKGLTGPPGRSAAPRLERSHR